jgi:hypothetical protein
VIFVSREIETQACQVLQSESVLMHYNELQARSAEVEAMAMNFEQRVAGAVAKAGLRAKLGPKKKADTKGTIGRGKPNHSEWISGETSVENPTSEMATPPSRKKDKIDNLSTAMELVNRKQLTRLDLL